MKRDSKAQLSKVTLFTLLSVASFFVVATIVLVVCAGLQINPFRERTTSFLIASFMGAIGLAVVSLFLNVAANLGRIADSRIPDEMSQAGNPLKNWFIGIATAAGLALALVFVGTYFSEQKFLRVMRSQADDVIGKNPELIEKIANHLEKNSSQEYWEVAKILKFLASQRRDLPHITLIYVSQFEGKPARYGIESYIWQEKESKDYQPPYYQCAQDLDCEYLESFFNGKSNRVLEKLQRKDDSFDIFFPFEKHGIRFVLRFDRTQRYGKIGS
jgi:hypothetical protein